MPRNRLNSTEQVSRSQNERNYQSRHEPPKVTLAEHFEHGKDYDRRKAVKKISRIQFLEDTFLTTKL
jgi:hypothetical protein